MHIQIVNFRLTGTDEAGDRDTCAQLAPAFAEIPGLLAKLWIADDATGTYGGVYLFRDRAAMEAFQASELFAAVGAHPHLTDITVRDFAVYDDLSRATQPELELLAGAPAGA